MANSRNNTNKITSLEQALGCLVISGFWVDYDSNEYGETISVKTETGLRSIGKCNYENITVVELVKLANDAIDAGKHVDNVERQTVSFQDALNMF